MKYLVYEYIESKDYWNLNTVCNSSKEAEAVMDYLLTVYGGRYKIIKTYKKTIKKHLTNQ